MVTSDNGPPFAASIRQDLFDWKKVGVTVPVSRELIDCPPGIQGITTAVREPFTDFLMDRLIVELRAYVLTHQLARHEATRTKTIEWPATPWQHWKSVHATAWWLRWFIQRWPVRQVRQTIDYREVWDELASYPWQNRVPMYPELGSPNRNVVLVSSDWTEYWNSEGHA